jgi:hypothetical protein
MQPIITHAGEAHVLDTALFIAVREWKARLADPRMAVLHEETEAQISMAEAMMARMRPPL